MDLPPAPSAAGQEFLEEHVLMISFPELQGKMMYMVEGVQKGNSYG